MTDSKDERKANRKERKGAKELLRIGNKAWLYRRDRLPPIEERAQYCKPRLTRISPRQRLLGSRTR